MADFTDGHSFLKCVTMLQSQKMLKNITLPLLLFAMMFLANYESNAQDKWMPFDIRGVDYRSGLLYDQVSRSIFIISDGAILLSSDFGESWKPIQNPYHGYFPHGWIVSRDTLLFTYGDYIVFATEDGGITLEPRISGLRQVPSSSLQHITGNPNRRNEIWLCQENIYKTTDAGRNWTMMLDAYSKLQSMSALAIHPLKDSVMFVVKNGQNKFEIYKSTDAAKSWISVSAPSMRWEEYPEMLVTPEGSIYVGPLISRNEGTVWNRAKYDSLSGGLYRMNGLIYNSKNDYIYAADDDHGLIRVKNLDSIYTVTKLGASDIPFAEPRRRAKMLEIDTVDGTILTVINDTFYTMRDNVVRTLPNAPYAVWIKHVFPVDAAGDTLVTATAKLLLRSTDRGKTWIEVGEMDGIDGKSFSQSPLNQNLIIASFGWYLIYSLDSGASFSYLIDCDSNYGGVRFNPHNPHYLYGVGPAIWRVHDSILIKHIVTPSQKAIGVELLNHPPTMPWLTGFTFDPLREGVIYVVGYNGNVNYLYRTTDNCQSWTELGAGVFTETPWGIEIDPKNPARMYVWSDEGIFISNDTGYTWRKSVAGMESKYIVHFLIDKDHPHILYASARNALQVFGLPDNERRGGVYESTDFGETWHRLSDSGLWTWNMYQITLLQNPRRLLAGTQCGAYEFSLPPVTSVHDAVNLPANEIALSQNYPNPFYERTTITLSLPGSFSDRQGFVLKIFDQLGREVLDLSEQAMQNLQVTILGSQLPRPGLYFYQLRYTENNTVSHSTTRVMSLIK